MHNGIKFVSGWVGEIVTVVVQVFPATFVVLQTLLFVPVEISVTFSPLMSPTPGWDRWGTPAVEIESIHWCVTGAAD